MKIQIEKDNDFYRILNFFLIHKLFYFKIVLYFFLIFLAVPFLFQLLAVNFGQESTFNFAVDHTTPFLIIIFLLTYFKFEKEFIEYDFKINNASSEYFLRIFYILFFLISFLLQFILKDLFWWKFVTDQFHLIVYMYSFLGFIGSFMLFLAVFGTKFFEKFMNRIILIMTIIISFFGMSYILKELWGIFSGIIVKMVSILLKLQFSSLDIFSSETYGLELFSFRVFIGDGCSGIESLALFFSIYLLIMLYDLDKLNLVKSLILLPFGMIGMFLVTILRIYMLMIVGKDNAELAMGLFHNNLGWIFFVIYLLIFWSLFYSFLLKDKFKNKNHKLNSNTNI